MASFRTSSYLPPEDEHLCDVWVEVCEDPIVGKNQCGNTFWSRVTDNYNSTKPDNMQTRNQKSLKDRLNIIKTAVRSLNGCIAQVESENPSGASNEDIMLRAKVLLMQNTKFKKGFKFDHVFLKMRTAVDVGVNSQRRNFNFVSSQSDASAPDSPVFSSPGISQFNVNLSDDTEGGSSSQTRPMGVKKAKLKRKNLDDSNRAIKSVEETNKKIAENMAQSNEQQKRAIDEYAKRGEQRTMAINLASIDDPVVREWWRIEQLKIIQKSSQQTQSENYSNNNFGQYFGDLGGSGSGLGPF